MFETERLILRCFTDKDADAIFAMRSDPEFMRFIKQPETRQQAVGWMQMVSHYWKFDNYGYWAVVLKETNETIGWSGTWNLFETNEKEIGFAIAKEFWGRGYATEAAMVALNYSFENRDATRVVALAMPENLSSRRVMKKLGMQLEEQKYFRSYGLELVYYSVTREDYARNSKINHAHVRAG